MGTSCDLFSGHGSLGALAFRLYRWPVVARWRVGTLRPLNVNLLWALGITQALESIKGSQRPAQQLLHTLSLSQQILTGWIETESASEELARPRAEANELLTWLSSALRSTYSSPSEPLADEITYEIGNSVLRFEQSLTYELKQLPAFLVEGKRGYSVDTLLKNIIETLPPDDRAALSAFARDNMQEAGACLAFERFTACGYHMARAVEDVARRYYELIKGQPQKLANGRDRVLAQIAGELQDVLDTWKAGEPGLLGLIVPTLNQFCRIYRHPLSHADLELKELTDNQAEIAFGHAIVAISTMIEDARIGGGHFALWFGDD